MTERNEAATVLLILGVALLVAGLLGSCATPIDALPQQPNSATPYDVRISGDYLGSNDGPCIYTRPRYSLTINRYNTPNPAIDSAGFPCQWESGIVSCTGTSRAMFWTSRHLYLIDMYAQTFSWRTRFDGVDYDEPDAVQCMLWFGIDEAVVL